MILYIFSGSWLLVHGGLAFELCIILRLHLWSRGALLFIYPDFPWDEQHPSFLLSTPCIACIIFLTSGRTRLVCLVSHSINRFRS